MNNKQRTIQKNNKHAIDKTMKKILKTIYMNNDFNNMKTIFYKQLLDNMRTIATILINNILKQYKEQYYKTMNQNNMHNTNNML